MSRSTASPRKGFSTPRNNNWNSTNSSDGSAAWTEAVVNLTAQPEPKLRIGVQARYFLLGELRQRPSTWTGLRPTTRSTSSVRLPRGQGEDPGRPLQRDPGRRPRLLVGHTAASVHLPARQPQLLPTTGESSTAVPLVESYGIAPSGRVVGRHGQARVPRLRTNLRWASA